MTQYRKSLMKDKKTSIKGEALNRNQKKTDKWTDNERT
jgi:hypothetical protein